MRSAGGVLLTLSVTAVSLFSAVQSAAGHASRGEEHPRVFTDGRLRPEFPRLHHVLAWLLGLVVLLALLCPTAMAAGPASASLPARALVAPEGALLVPGAFRLAGSNGFTLDVIGVPPRAGHASSLVIFASAKGESVSYVAPATVTETSMQADLGELGEISVNFRRTNEAATVPCGKRTIRFDSGQYEGKIVFHGEEGYTNVEATTVPGNLDFIASAICREIIFGSSQSGRPRGAALFVRNPALGPELSISKRRPGAAAQITAWDSEWNNGISIKRFATLRMPGRDFTYDPRLRTATVRPPAPFAGSARFDLAKKAGQRWSGDLTVDLPGRAAVPLVGPTLRATLIPN